MTSFSEFLRDRKVTAEAAQPSAFAAFLRAKAGTQSAAAPQTPSPEQAESRFAAFVRSKREGK